MIEHNIDFKGHFKIQSIDIDGKIVDEWEDDNMIMEDARVSMSELFSNLDTNTFINRFQIGTLGHVGESILIPKGKDDGFVKERDRLFSEVFENVVNSGTEVEIIRKNDVLNINTTDPLLVGYYRFIANDVENYAINDNVLGDELIWIFMGTSAPYKYNINFELPKTNDISEGTPAINITEDEIGAGSSVKVLQQDTSVTFTFDIATSAGNSQSNLTSIFTEAALYVNSRIFAMKTFKAKIKDSTVLLRIIWTITF